MSLLLLFLGGADTSGAQFPGANVRVTLEIAFATNPGVAEPAWVDVTEYLYGFEIRRGRQHELDRTEAGTCTIVLKNDDRRFDPSYTAGPYYPNVRPMNKVRLSAVYGGVTYRLFTGHVEGWPQEWNHNLGRVQVTAVDGFKALQLKQLNTSFAAQRADVRIGAVLDAVGWPSSARSLATGQSTFQEATAMSAVAALDHVQTAVLSENGRGFINGAGAFVFIDRHAPYNSTASLAQFGPQDSTLDQQQTSNDQDDDLWSGQPIAQTFTPGLTGHLPKVTLRPFISTASPSAANVYVEARSVDSASGPATVTATGILAVSQTVSVTALDAENRDYDFAFLNPPLLSSGRKYALCVFSDASSSGHGRIETFSSNAYADALGEAYIGTSGGQGWDKSGVAGLDLYFRTYMQDLPYRNVVLDYSDARIWNEVRVTRQNGTEQVTADTATSQKRYFPRTLSRSGLLLDGDREAEQAAAFLLTNYKEPSLRVVSLGALPLQDVALWPQVLGRELGDRVTVKVRPGTSTEVLTQQGFVEGIEHGAGPNGRWQVTWRLSAEGAAYAVGSPIILDDPSSAANALDTTGGLVY